MATRDSLTQSWLRQNVLPYANKDRVYADIDQALNRFQALRPKSDVYTFDDGRTQLLLCLHGLLPIVYRGASYNIPLNVWVTREYPREPPLVYVVPTADMLVRPGRFLDVSGRCSHEYLQHWQRKDEGCNLTGLLEDLQDQFSREPPVYSKPPPSRQEQERPPPVPARPTVSAAAYQSAPLSPPRPPPRPEGFGPVIQSPPPPPLPPITRGSPSQQATVNRPPTTALNHANVIYSHQPFANPSYPAHSTQIAPPPPPPPPPPPSVVPFGAHGLALHPSAQSSVQVRPNPPPVPPVPIPNLLDEDDESPASPSQQGLPPSTLGPGPAPSHLPPRPPNPELLDLHRQVHHKLTSELHSLSKALALDAERLRAHQNDLLAGEPAIRDEMARLEAVKDVCTSVADRTRSAVQKAETNIAELRRKGDPEVDELVCATSIVHNQLINLVAEDNAIEDTVYHLHRGLNTGRIDLERFLRTTRVLAEEQFMKRALINKIQAGVSVMSPSVRPEWA
ncbi:UEV-domain-containing protein [Ephemerocybe angulata]|uniref:UEV-domain-containing protein n=1 Tax=Ephemerocybe angulata TaxID=980116 RepID=A0A8H6IIZ0_9AGAR|nr:UEV-domain-containing protein [Tulosesus angulatus]